MIHPDQRMLDQTVVIIPARNEAKSIASVLNDLPPVSLVIVVDNGSSDATPRIASELGAYVVEENIAGYGRACRRGLYTLQRLIGKRRRCTEAGVDRPADHDCPVHFDCQGRWLNQMPRYVVFLDADYSDYPERLVDLVRPLDRGEFDFVLGSRILGEREPGAMPIQARWGNRLACLLMKRIWQTTYTDLGPFRAIRYDCLKRLRMKDTNFGWTIEMQIKAAEQRLRTLEVPIAYRRRVGTSKISGTLTGTVKAGYKILYTVAKYALQRRKLP